MTDSINLDALYPIPPEPRPVTINGRTLPLRPIRGRGVRKIREATAQAERAGVEPEAREAAVARVWVEVLAAHLIDAPAEQTRLIEELTDLLPHQLGALIQFASAPLIEAQRTVDAATDATPSAEGNADRAGGTPPPSAA